jgi:metal-responsive CopG/Arc/MetJ family transcriptional regulator
MGKTLVELDPFIALALERLASMQGCTREELIGEALRRYVLERDWPKPRRGGLLHSGRSDISGRTELILDEAHEKGQWP